MITKSLGYFRNQTAIALTTGCLILALAFGIRSGFGIFLQPISLDLGWERGVFAFALALQNLLWGASQPFVGAISDKYGSGRTIAVGGLFYMLGIALMAVSSTPLILNISTGLLIGFGLSGTSFAVVLGAMAKVVPAEQRSLTLGLGTAAGSMGQFIMVPLGQYFLDAFGWSNALLMLAALSFIMVPAAAGVMGRSKPTKKSTEQTPKKIGIKEALAEAYTHKGFRYLTLGFFVCGFHVAFIAAHLPAYLVDQGLSPKYGAWSLALVGLFNIVGSIGAGILGSRYSKKYCLSILYVCRSIVIALFLIIPITPATTLIFAAFIGILWLSTVPLTSGIVEQVFGPQYMSTLFGIVFFSHQVGSFLGVWLGGYFYDSTGSYDLVWWAGVVLGIASAIIHWPINEQSLRKVVPA